MEKKILFIACFFTISFMLKAQIITTVAGNGIFGYSGDGGQATNAELAQPGGVSTDASGNIYVADVGNNRIRKIDASGIITSAIGNGIQGFSGDGGQASAAELNHPTGVLIDLTGNIYIADTYNYRIRKVNPSGIINTIIGNGTAGYTGDGGQATNAEISTYGNGLAIDVLGNLFIADGTNNRIRKVSPFGIITTIAGNGTAGFSGDGGQATDAELSYPNGITLDYAGNLYIADGNNNVIRMVNTSGIITTIAGSGTLGFNGDGGQAIIAEFYNPVGVMVDALNNLYINDGGNHRIRKISSQGLINTVIGDGMAGFSGDGGLATLAEIYYPDGMVLDESGNFFLGDRNNNRVRKVTNIAATGISQVPDPNSKIAIYPNPSNGTINITSTYNINELKVTDLLGQTVYEAKPDATNATLTLNNAGIYFITLTCGKEVSTQKIIISK